MIVKIMLVLLVLQNEYMPPEWLPLLQVVCHRIGDEEEDSSIYFQLLSTMVEAGNEKIAPHIPDIVCLLVREISKKLPLDLEPWPQVSSYVQTLMYLMYLYFYSLANLLMIVIFILVTGMKMRTCLVQISIFYGAMWFTIHCL